MTYDLSMITGQRKKPILEIVLKCDAAGSVEAVTNSLAAVTVPDVDIIVVHSGIGAITKSDVLLLRLQAGSSLAFRPPLCRHWIKC